MTVQNEVLFDFNSAALRSSSRSALRDMANVFEKYPDTTIRVEGHTDSIGTAAYNERLSERRASTVANYLEDLGVRSARIRAVGYGKSQPRATNNTAYEGANVPAERSTQASPSPAFVTATLAR